MKQVMSYRGTTPVEGTLVTVAASAKLNETIHFLAKDGRLAAVGAVVGFKRKGGCEVIIIAAGEQKLPTPWGVDDPISVSIGRGSRYAP